MEPPAPVIRIGLPRMPCGSAAPCWAGPDRARERSLTSTGAGAVDADPARGEVLVGRAEFSPRAETSRGPAGCGADRDAGFRAGRSGPPGRRRARSGARFCAAGRPSGQPHTGPTVEESSMNPTTSRVTRRARPPAAARRPWGPCHRSATLARPLARHQRKANAGAHKHEADDEAASDDGRGRPGRRRRSPPSAAAPSWRT